MVYFYTYTRARFTLLQLAVNGCQRFHNEIFADKNNLYTTTFIFFIFIITDMIIKPMATKKHNLSNVIISVLVSVLFDGLGSGIKMTNN